MPLTPKIKRRLAVILPLVALALVGGGLLWQHRQRAQSDAFRLDARVPAQGPEFSTALEQTVGTPMRPGHRVTLIRNGHVLDALADTIAQARSSLDIDMYIWTRGAASDRILAALRARPRGVVCRVVLDAIGSPDRDESVRAGLRAADCEAHRFREHGPLTARNHRKIIVADGRVALTGGFAVDDRWLGDAEDDKHWRDTAVRVEGPAVADMQLAFAEDWQEAGGGLLPASDFVREEVPGGGVRAAFVGSTAAPVVTKAERLTQLAVAAAHQRLWIENAYFIPGRPLLDLLGQRAAEGVDVRVLVPGRKSDSKFSFTWQQREYGDLRPKGVRIWEFQPTMMHAKTMVVDGVLSIVGSVNLDPLSLDRLQEGALVVEDAALAKQLEGQFEEDRARSKLQD